MKKITIICYLAALIVLATTSLVFSFINDNVYIVILELLVDGVVIFGVYLYLINNGKAWWLWLILPAAFGEIYLLTYDYSTSDVDIYVWLLILIPAFYMNYMVSQMPSRERGT